MLTFTTCASCKGPLELTYVGQESHPTCPQTESERLAREFVDAIQRGDEREASRLEKLLNQPDPVPALGSAALWYASVGWPVFPLTPGGKQPAISKRDGGNGLYDATTNPFQIREWWGQEPSYNIGIPTGSVSGFDVIDVDGPEGVRSLSELGDDVLPDVHGRAATPRGLHLFVLSTGDGNRAGVRPGIDYRGKGGFIVASPSVVDGKRYSWLVKPSPTILKGK